MGAFPLSLTPIIRAGIAIIAFSRKIASAHSAATDVFDGAEVAIIAGCLVGCVDTAFLVITLHIEADIVIFTGNLVFKGHATQYAIALVQGADIPVFAVDGATDAIPKLACVLNGAGVSIQAGIGIEGMLTAAHRGADIIGAGILVIAFDFKSQADAVGANVALGTNAAIVTRVFVLFEFTSDCLIAGIVRADILIVAFDQFSAACAILAEFIGGAFILVVTDGENRLVGAPFALDALGSCTWVSVIARDRGSAACALLADIKLGTDFPVVTGDGVDDRGTAIDRITEVVGADVSVIAVQIFARTNPFFTSVIQGAYAVVIAGSRQG